MRLRVIFTDIPLLLTSFLIQKDIKNCQIIFKEYTRVTFYYVLKNSLKYTIKYCIWGIRGGAALFRTLRGKATARIGIND